MASREVDQTLYETAKANLARSLVQSKRRQAAAIEVMGQETNRALTGDQNHIIDKFALSLQADSERLLTRQSAENRAGLRRRLEGIIGGRLPSDQELIEEYLQQESLRAERDD